MFTGIIEELGTITAIERGADAARFTIAAPLAVSDARHGDSISVSGVCLTVIEQSPDGFTADVMAQSLVTSTLGTAEPGRRVNIERAAQLGSRLGGHIVQGHVDATARLLSRTDAEAWRVLRFSLDDEHAALVTAKGSITVDGVSLTVSAISAPAESAQWFEVSLIPETLTATTLGERQPGDAVNIETDILARHVERMIALNTKESRA